MGIGDLYVNAMGPMLHRTAEDRGESHVTCYHRLFDGFIPFRRFLSTQIQMKEGLHMENKDGTGYLKIRAASANGAFPVSGALVFITDENGRTAASLRTDISGLTETVALSAPSATLSQSPSDSKALPFAVYSVQISKDGFYPVEDLTVPVFDSITAIQSVNLIPLSEFSPYPPNPRPQIIEAPEYPDLRGMDAPTPHSSAFQ